LMIGHRRVIPEVTYLLTKKCFDERFLLKPTPECKKALRYELARRAKQYGMKLHSFCFMSNHFHLVVTDCRGNLPAFMRDFLTNTSKALQKALEVDCPIWSGKRYSAVRLLDLDAAVRKVAYVLLNPTHAELTRPKEWPGVTSAVYAVGQSVTVRRPNFYFSKRYCPETVELTIDPISPEFGLSSSRQIKACNDSIVDFVARTSRSIAAEAKRKGRTFAGAAKVRKMPTSKRTRREVGARNPRFATRDEERLNQAIWSWKKFEWDHLVALMKLKSGDRDVIFPCGTYGYRMIFGVRVAPRQ
ncbi:MAG: transposase, partial [Planctomycetota bacterium]